jgi:hypothetical protein
MNGLEVVRGLIARGYSPAQAAALSGHIGQESGYNSAAVNQNEGAHGLLQWRGSRWQGLQDFAKSQGKDPTDPQTQLDYIGKEMHGPEAKSSTGFLAAPDVASASAALKPFIRFGDDSAGTRLANANNLFTQLNGAAPAAAAPVGALAGAAAAPVGTDPTAAAPAAPPTIGSQVGALGKTLTGKPEDFAPLQQLQMPQANTGQSAQIAAAIARGYGIGS